MSKESSLNNSSPNSLKRKALFAASGAALILSACAGGGDEVDSEFIVPYICDGVITAGAASSEGPTPLTASEAAAQTGIEQPEAALAVLDLINEGSELDQIMIPTGCVQGESFYTSAKDGEDVIVGDIRFTVNSDFAVQNGSFPGISVTGPDGSEMRDGVAVSVGQQG